MALQFGRFLTRGALKIVVGQLMSRVTIHRILAHACIAERAPKKRPKSSFVRFEVETPNQC